jgi:hypothetical protein
LANDWHDMDFVSISPDLLLDCSDCKWQLKLTNSQGVSLSTDIINISGSTIYPYWDTPNNENGTPNYLHLEGHFWPVKYDIYVYTANEDPIYSLYILNRNINLYDSYLYDKYQYYNSEIYSFSANMVWLNGNIDLLVKILQPDHCFLTVKVSVELSRKAAVFSYQLS